MTARLLRLLVAAAENVARDGRSYAVAAASLVLPLALLLAGVAIGEGVQEESLASVRAGAGVYCTWDMFGRDSALPAAQLAALARIDGVVDAVPRIVGRLPVGDVVALIVGVPRERLAGAALEPGGAPPRDGSEALVGCELARQLGLAPGRKLALEGDVIRLFTVSGVVASTSALASAKAVMIDLGEAATVFGESAHVSDACLFTRAGYEDAVAAAAQRIDPRLRVQTRELVAGYVGRGRALREGSFALLVALALALAIAAFAVLGRRAGHGRRLEIALLKAQGWTTGDVMALVALENLIVSVLAAGAALLLALAWVRALGGPLVAPFFLPDLPLFPAIHVPARFTPLPPLLALLFSLAVTMSGSLLATWRTAIARPAEALR